MNPDPAEKFESLVDGILRPMVVGPRRRRTMRAELLAHLWQAYEEERSRGLDESAAIEAAVRRFGPALGLRDQLQASVPSIEQWFAFLLGSKEIAMFMGPRLLGWVLCVVGGAFAFGIAVVLPAAAKVAELSSASPRSAELLKAEQILKGSLVSLAAFSLLVTLAGMSTLAYAFITRKRTAH